MIVCNSPKADGDCAKSRVLNTLLCVSFVCGPHACMDFVLHMSYKLCEPFPPIFLTTSFTPQKPYSLFVWPHISNCRKAKINERQTYRPPSYEHFQSDYLTTPFIQFVNFG